MQSEQTTPPKSVAVDALKSEWAGICEAMNRGTYRGTEADALARIEAIKALIAESARADQAEATIAQMSVAWGADAVRAEEAEAAMAAVVLSDVGPNLGASSPEPSLRSILVRHYLPWMLLGDANIIADKYLRSLASAPGLAILAELRAERDELRSRVRWNIEESGDLVRVCRGDHEKGDDCSAHEERFVPEAERDRLAAANAVLEAKVAGLVEALKPFSDAWGVAFGKRPEVVAGLSLGELSALAQYHVPATAFRAARAALATQEGNPV